MSGSPSIPQVDSSPPQSRCYSTQTICAITACALAIIASIALVLLASKFGPVGSVNFCLAAAGGGAAIFLATTALLCIAIVKFQKRQSDQALISAENRIDNAIEKPTFKAAPNNLPSFQNVHSGILIPGDPNITDRKYFLKSDKATVPPVISASPFVSHEMIAHLMRNKKDTAIGIKYKPGDQITNMEAALHTFVTPICSINMIGDYAWKGFHEVSTFSNGQQRQVIMSASIQPDFEKDKEDSVMLQVAAVGEKSCEGRSLPNNMVIPSSEEKNNPEVRNKYDQQLKQHMVYHLTQDHKLPAKNKITHVMQESEAIVWLEQQICNDDFDSSSLRNKFVNIAGHTLSLEIFFNIYAHELSNEFSALEALLPQGYIYTIDPPGFFVFTLGKRTDISNRLQILALKNLFSSRDATNLKAIAFNDFADKKCVDLLSVAFNKKNIAIFKRTDLFNGEGGTYAPSEKDANYALVLHNNSDAFGQNIEFEGKSSLDGVIGKFSNAACVLKRDRPDLLNHIF